MFHPSPTSLWVVTSKQQKPYIDYPHNVPQLTLFEFPWLVNMETSSPRGSLSVSPDARFQEMGQKHPLR